MLKQVKQAPTIVVFVPSGQSEDIYKCCGQCMRETRLVRSSVSLSLSWYEFCVQNINNPVHRSVVAGYADVDCNTLARFAGVYHCHSNLLCPQCLSSCRIHHDTSHCVKKHATSASWAGGHHLKQCLDQFMRERRAVGAVLGAAETHQAGTSVDR